MSSRLSLLKSPIAAEYGEDDLPVEYDIDDRKLPFPYPKNTSILLVPELATTISEQLSLLKSPTANEHGEDDVPIKLVICPENVPLP